MNNMFVVAKPPSGDAFNKLMAFLEENRMEFSVRCSEPNKVLAVPTSSRASEIIDFPTAKKIRKESKLDFQKITFNQSEISDNLADNELRIPKEESKVSPIAQINNEQHVDYNGWSPGEDFRALMATWDMDKLKCEVCKRKMMDRAYPTESVKRTHEKIQPATQPPFVNRGTSGGAQRFIPRKQNN
ncbi:Protein CBG24327 [Caenorhabditis briggsae]|uniref:Protein CBG24327 n=1 Tax=Caenorhabditis briggsae TaxID=6238 RepID=A8WKG9_CAEBR|nr:Protein CBG24327 [Caenorhabditis briggsae]CAP20964.2 Protein CBG24327 [Caenorhabditis briggsae]